MLRPLLALLATQLALPLSFAVTPTPGEMQLRDRWVGSVFEPQSPKSRPSMKLLYEDAAEGIFRGRSWRGTPFQLGDKNYTHGIAFNSTKHLLIRLGEPGDRFSADVGLENNDDTRRGAAMGQGSVTFHVLVGGKEVFASPVLRLKDGPKPIDVPLDGASEFEIRVNDGGDGRSWDQALWAAATVKLRSGTSLRLQDLEPGESPHNPFVASFQIAGTPSEKLLPKWSQHVEESSSNDLKAPEREQSIAWNDPASGLAMSLDATVFRDFPAVEWTVHMRNTSGAKSKIVESLESAR